MFNAYYGSIFIYLPPPPPLQLESVSLDILKFHVSHFPGLKISIRALKYIIKDTLADDTNFKYVCRVCTPCTLDLKFDLFF